MIWFNKIIFIVFIANTSILGNWTKLLGVPIDGTHKITSLTIGTDSSGLKKAIFAGLDSGIFYSVDTGKSWKLYNNSPKKVLSLTDNAYAGTSDSGIYTKWPDSWRFLGFDQLNPINSLSVPGNLILMGTNNGIYCSSLNSRNPSNIGLLNSKINSLSVTLYNWNSQLMAGNGYIYASSDSGVFFSDYYFQNSSPSSFPIGIWTKKILCKQQIN